MSTDDQRTKPAAAQSGEKDRSHTHSEHMYDIAKGYDQLADFWHSDAFDRTNGIAAHERAFAFCRNPAEQGARALDVGCGSSGRIIDLLSQHGFATEGLDLSPGMLKLARARHPDVLFHLADICTWSPPHTYEFISAWDSIWHVPLGEHASVLRKLFGSLAPEGVCLFTMGGLDQPDSKTDAVMGPTMHYSTLGIPHTLALIGDAGCICRHMEYDQHPEPHVYMIVQRNA